MGSRHVIANVRRGYLLKLLPNTGAKLGEYRPTDPQCHFFRHIVAFFRRKGFLVFILTGWMDPGRNF